MSTFQRLLSSALCLLAVQAHGATLQSAAKLTFDDAGTLYIADWKAARVYAVKVPAVGAAQGAPFNLHDVQASIASALKVRPAALRFDDLAVQPGTGMAYVSVTLGAKAAVVAIDAAGKVRTLPTANLATWAGLPTPPPPVRPSGATCRRRR